MQDEIDFHHTQVLKYTKISSYIVPILGYDKLTNFGPNLLNKEAPNLFL